MKKVFEVIVSYSYDDARFKARLNKRYKLLSDSDLLARDKAIELLKSELKTLNYAIDSLIIEYCNISFLFEVYE